MNYRHPLLLLASLFLLAACSSGPEAPTAPAPSPITQPPVPGFPTQPPAGGNSISGTVTGPGDVSGTFIFGCLNGDCANSQSAVIQIDSTGNYSLDNLVAGSYQVLAWKDINGNQQPDDGDYLGGYTQDGQNLASVTPPASNISITMQVISTNPAPTDPTNPTDPPPSGGSGFSGTVTSTTSDVVGTIVLACVPTSDGNINCDNAPATQVTQPGTSAPYSIDSVPSGQYAVVALLDADGDNTFELGGAYPEVISPPANGINIQLEALNTTNLGTTEVKIINVDTASVARPYIKALQDLLE